MSHDRLYRPILSAVISAINLAAELFIISPRKLAGKISRFYHSSVIGLLLWLISAAQMDWSIAWLLLEGPVWTSVYHWYNVVVSVLVNHNYRHQASFRRFRVVSPSCTPSDYETTSVRGHSPTGSIGLYLFWRAVGVYVVQRRVIEKSLLGWLSERSWDAVANGVCHLLLLALNKVKLSILDYERWVWSWSRFLGSQSAGDLVIDPVVGCRYFPPGPRLLSEPKRSPPWPLPY